MAERKVSDEIAPILAGKINFDVLKRCLVSDLSWPAHRTPFHVFIINWVISNPIT